MTQDKSASRGVQGASTAGSAQSTSGMGTGTSGDMAAQAKETARQAASQAKEQVSSVAGQAREQVGTRVEGQKERVANSLGDVAHMLRQTGDQMRDQDQVGLTGFVDRAASQVENFSSYLREHDMGYLMDDVERFARREPAIFLGGAFLLGLLGARFMKSSRPRPRYDERYYASSSAYETPYRPYYTGYADDADYPGRSGYSAGYTTGTGTAGMGYTGTSGTSGTGATPSGQGGRRGAGIYDSDREGS